MAALLGGASRGSAMTMHALKLPSVAKGISSAAQAAAKVAGKLAKVAGTLAKIGPALGPALGIFSAATGLINDLTKPSIQVRLISCYCFVSQP